MTPKFAILICTRNRPDDIARCLASIQELDHPDYQVFVLDQSEVANGRMLGKQAQVDHGGINYIRSATVGKSAALNQLLHVACADYLAFTDDDTVVPSDWLRQIEAAFCTYPEADIVYGQVAAGEAPPEIAEPHIPAFTFADRRFLDRGEIAGMGANMAMRHSVLEHTAHFDPYLGPGAPMPAGEEGDFMYRAQLAGARVMLDPDIKLVHLACRNGSEWCDSLYSYGFGDAGVAMKHLRCRDLSMFARISFRYVQHVLRLNARRLQRRPHGEQHYLRGYRAGIRRSLQFDVDRTERLYAGLKSGRGAERTANRGRRLSD